MMVTFVSQCEKKALPRTRRVLDAFANRIGERTWQTVITEEGLIAVKTLLRKTVTKNTAVSCHWMRSRSRSELIWVVGNRQKFNAEGLVPVNSTKKNHQHKEWENNWEYLPVIKALVGVSALLHDWGKASVLFQKKLKVKTIKGDPLRHEWISCVLLHALVQLSGDCHCDDAWLNILINGELDEEKILTLIKNQTESSSPLNNLPPLAQMVAWLIVSHHRLPVLMNGGHTKWHNYKTESLAEMLTQITDAWGYQNKFDEDEYKKHVVECFSFKNGLLSQSDPWRKATKKWAQRLQTVQPTIDILIKNGAWRLVLHHSRLCLMLGDHYYSSCDADPKWQDTIALYANTHTIDDKMVLKQKLDEHLVRVSENALRISQSLARFTTDMDVANDDDIKNLKQKSPKAYEWQDIAADKINKFKRQNEPLITQGCGWFIVNMASTGCGKTFANAKIMRALSDDGDSLRYVLALGLRTLTLQTGDEYREKIGLGRDKLAVLIGSAAVQALHALALHASALKKNEEDKDLNDEMLGSESLAQLLEEDLDYEEAPNADFLDAIIPKHNLKQANKNKAFLYKPVLACTIDHLIAATETTRGGRYILPCLRLLSSDLVIDEVDDFGGKDLIAIGRLIHLAGMLGRKVMISSATIPPALAIGFFNAYQEGWRLYAAFKNISVNIASAWVDEFTTQVHLIDKQGVLEKCGQYGAFHQQFITKRVVKLKDQVIKRKAYIVDCQDIFMGKDSDNPPTNPSLESMNSTVKLTREQRYFEKIKNTIEALHRAHHTVDVKTGKKVSFGVVRVANIPPCIALSQYLMSCDWQADISPKVMAYHSRQVLLLRHVQEKHLDAVLKRQEKNGEMPKAFSNTVIQGHLENTSADNVIFILVATPVEEVGRDHDFDWAVIEPSSYRSIIQLVGRVRRHRKDGIEQPNIAIMQYNLKALRKNGNPAYCRPGYETSGKYSLNTHDLSKLVDIDSLQHSVDAIPRIQPAKLLKPQQCLADLEHQVLSDSLMGYTKTGPNYLQAWLSECWWLTALPQQFNRFRESSPDLQIYLIWRDDQLIFCERDAHNKFVNRTQLYSFKKEKISEVMRARLWLERDYEKELKQLVNSTENDSIAEYSEADFARKMENFSVRYGELTIPIYDSENENNKQYIYSDQFGLYEMKKTT